MQKSLSILFVGYATIDIINGHQYFGGAAGAMSLNASTIGIKSSLFAPLSRDPLGNLYIQKLKNANVDCSYCNLNSPSIPTCIITDQLGMGSTRQWQDNGALNFFINMPIPRKLDQNFDGIFVCNTHRDVGEKLAKNINARCLFYIPGPKAVNNPNWVSPIILDKTLIIFCNEEEEPSIWQTKPFAHGVKIIVCTYGKQGGVVYLSNSREIPYQAEPIQSVDPTGAGDTFALGFTHEYLIKNDIMSSIKSGQKLAEQVISQIGSSLI